MTDRGTVEYPFERPKKAKPMKLPKTAAATTLALALAGPAAAREVLGVFGDWTAFKDDDGKACYMASAPKSAKGNYTKRGDPYLMVLKRIGGRGPDEVSVEAGYSYKADSQVTLTVVIGQSDKTFKMFTKGETTGPGPRGRPGNFQGHSRDPRQPSWAAPNAEPRPPISTD